MLQFKIHGATPHTGKSLCLTCKKATIVKGQNCEEVLFCSGPFANGIVPFKIAECGDYHPSNMPWLHEMYDMAWEVKARKRGVAGFEPDKTEMEITITPPNSPESPS